MRAVAADRRCDRAVKRRFDARIVAVGRQTAAARAENALAAMIREGEQVTFRGLASRARVSLDFLYRNAGIRGRIERALKLGPRRHQGRAQVGNHELRHRRVARPRAARLSHHARPRLKQGPDCLGGLEGGVDRAAGNRRRWVSREPARQAPVDQALHEARVPGEAQVEHLDGMGRR